MRRQNSRGAHCVIDRISLWASTPSPDLLRRPLRSSILQSQNYNRTVNRNQHIRHHHQSSSTPFLQNHTPLVSHRKRSHFLSPACQTATPRAMSSDDAYMSFLEKANADLNNARTQQAQQSSVVRTEIVDARVRVPAPLTSVDVYYISETDEPFEPVTLRWEGASKGDWPGPSQLSDLISPNANLSSSITTLSPASFDPRNQYSSALRAVRAAVTQASGGGEPGIDQSDVDVKVYRVEVGTSRVEYYLLSLNVEEGTIVGLRAKAVES